MFCFLFVAQGEVAARLLKEMIYFQEVRTRAPTASVSCNSLESGSEVQFLETEILLSGTSDANVCSMSRMNFGTASIQSGPNKKQENE